MSVNIERYKKRIKNSSLASIVQVLVVVQIAAESRSHRRISVFFFF